MRFPRPRERDVARCLGGFRSLSTWRGVGAWGEGEVGPGDCRGSSSLFLESQFSLPVRPPRHDSERPVLYKVSDRLY